MFTVSYVGLLRGFKGATGWGVKDVETRALRVFQAVVDGSFPRTGDPNVVP